MKNSKEFVSRTYRGALQPEPSPRRYTVAIASKMIVTVSQSVSFTSDVALRSCREHSSLGDKRNFGARRLE